ncbi:MAG: PKD domain-containing protein, partial [Bacteroidia bacterium]|nr:PKD domain-containing protein [Bacteroidia bacterium]
MKNFNLRLNKNHSLLFLLVLVIGLTLNNLAAQTIDPKSVGVISRADSINTPLNSLRGNGMGFTPNKGQFVDVNKKQCPNILYKGGGGGADVYIRKDGISYVTSDVQKKFREVQAEVESEQVANGKSIYDMKSRSSELLGRMSFNVHRLDVDFIGGNAEYSTVESDQVEGFTNYYLPHCPQGITKVYSHNRITAKNIYPNIDVVYYGGKAEGLKYDIVVNPNGDPNRIKLNYSGVKEMRVTNEGGLRIETSLSIINEYLPKVYQIINGQVVDVGCKYKLEMVRGSKLKVRSEESQQSTISPNHYIVTFELGAYNHGLPLIIDPWATYYSGGGASFTIGTASGVAADATGSVLVTGHTATLDFPVSAGAFQLTKGNAAGLMDAFLVKFDASGTRIFGTYFGGNKSDEAYGITADGNDDILISGMTQSTNCPTKNPGGGAYFQSALSGGANADAFVAKFTPAGLLTWATLYGGGGTEEADDVITDGSNNVIIVGKTASTNLPTQAPYQAALSGTSDAFVIKFNSGCVRQWATYYGGAVDESALGVATDGADNIFFTGLTSSTNFPVLTAFQGTFGGIGDAFAVKLNGATGFPLWATYYGGTGNDNACGVAVDALGNCIVVGLTQSTTAIASAGANQMTFAGADDAFIVKFNSAGVRLWGTYHGGVNAEVTGGCAVDSKNNIYWYGEVEDAQPDPSWITTCAYQNTYNGMEDQIISKFTPDGKLTCTTAVGGPGEEDFDGGSVAPHFDIAVSDPYIYIAAHVRQGGYPVTPGAFQTINRAPANGENDAFINQLCMNICQQKFTVTNASANKTVVCINDPITFSSSVNSSCDTTDMRFKWTFTGASPNSSTAANPVVSYASPGYYSVKLVVSTPCQKDSVIKTNYIIVNPCTIKAMATSDTVCSGICTTVIATGSNGKAPYTYSWSTGSTSVTANVCPTTTTVYTVMITDANGNYAATNATVFVYPIMTITSTATNQTCTTNGLASITVSGGTPAYTYTWSSGQTSTTSGYAPGNYTVTVTDALGCTLTKAFNLTSSSPVSASF